MQLALGKEQDLHGTPQSSNTPLQNEDSQANMLTLIISALLLGICMVFVGIMDFAQFWLFDFSVLQEQKTGREWTLRFP